jgi:hypothetical protein
MEEICSPKRRYVFDLQGFSTRKPTLFTKFSCVRIKAGTTVNMK